MKIINTESGKAYQLFPDTELSVERTNPFFNDYGEQTLPVSLPDSEYNRSIMNQPDKVNRKNKVTFHDTSIQDGEYFVPCRQAILGVTPGDKIETSFYMNEGSFYSRLENTYMSDVFGEETVPGVNNLDQALSFIKSLFKSDNSEFAIFQVEISNSRFMNVYYNGTLMAETEQKETVDGKEITVPRGFYLSPFLKANFVLKRMFSYFGYTLLDNFFTQTAQFRNMVFINNVADAVVTGKIYYSQLLPNVTCKEILELFRKKFMCEFITDEVEKTVRIVLFNELLAEQAYSDYSAKLVEQLVVEYPEEYKQLILESRDSIGSLSFDSIPEMKSKYSSVQFNSKRGEFYRYGYNLGTIFAGEIYEVVADASQRYYEGGNLPTESIEIPECIPVYKSFFLYIGDEQFLNSTLQADGESSSDAESDSSTTKMYLMLAFAYCDGTTSYGTVSNYISTGIVGGVEIRIGDYSLVYNGDEGIFEKFYRKYDTLLRNSLHTVKGKFLLGLSEKSNIPSIAMLDVKGNRLLMDKMTYQLGGKKDITQIDFLTLQLYEPVSNAKYMSELLPGNNGYAWVVKKEDKSIPADEYQNSPYKNAKYSMVYPPAPTGDKMGKRFFETKTAAQIGGVYLLTTAWLEVVQV
mgnify:FL=1|jgi:hypothetical protein